MRTRSTVFAAVLVGVLAGPVTPAYALAGGLVTTNVSTSSDRAEAIAIQPDGKIVAAGTTGRLFALVRYNPNGTLDAGFGTAGIVTTRITGGPLPVAVINAVAIQPDGRIVVAGQNPSHSGIGSVVLARYNPDGSLDTGFGTAGIVKTTFTTARGDPLYFGNALAVRDDGRIMVVGTGGSASLIAARYNSDGSLDAGFGAGGKVVTDFPNTNVSHGHAVVLRADGRIVAAGSAFPDFGLTRYNPNGTLDPTFGQGGLVTTDFAGGTDQGRAAVGRTDGRVVVAGFTSAPGQEDVSLARYNPDGSLDSTFGRGGKVTTDFANTRDQADGAALQTDGKIVIAGRAGDDVALARYNPDGSLDPTFGRGGKVTTDFAGGADSAAAVTIQPDGRILVAGRAATAGTGDDFALARYTRNGTLDPTFGT